MKTIPVSLILGCILAPATVLAQPQGKPDSPPRAEEGGEHGPHRPFLEAWKAADTDHDGFISRAEFDAMPRIQNLPEEKRANLFKRLDKDGDGKLSREELVAMIRGRDGEGHPMQRLWELDVDHSGGISFEEFKAGRLFSKLSPEKQKALFDRLDTNGDGVITPADKPKPPFKHEGGGPGGPHMNLRQMIRQFDKNGDGALSFEEFRAVPWVKNLGEDEQEKRFQALDKNHDLKLSPADLPPPGEDQKEDVPTPPVN